MDRHLTDTPRDGPNHNLETYQQNHGGSNIAQRISVSSFSLVCFENLPPKKEEDGTHPTSHQIPAIPVWSSPSHSDLIEQP